MRPRLSALLADVEAGEDLIICRDPVPIARVTRIHPEAEGRDLRAPVHGTVKTAVGYHLRNSGLAPRGAYPLMAFVPDASIAGAWLLPGQAATLADEALDRLRHVATGVNRM